jgi:hypothetical protein
MRRGAELDRQRLSLRSSYRGFELDRQKDFLTEMRAGSA